MDPLKRKPFKVGDPVSFIVFGEHGKVESHRGLVQVARDDNIQALTDKVKLFYVVPNGQVVHLGGSISCGG